MSHQTRSIYEASCRYFERVVPEIFARQPKGAVSRAGSIAFRVEDIGDWTVDLGNAEKPVARGFDAYAELCLWFSAEGFLAFLEGNLETLSPEHPEALRHFGNLELLGRFGNMLAPAKSFVSLRANN